MERGGRRIGKEGEQKRKEKFACSRNGDATRRNKREQRARMKRAREACACPRTRETAHAYKVYCKTRARKIGRFARREREREGRGDSREGEAQEREETERRAERADTGEGTPICFALEAAMLRLRCVLRTAPVFCIRAEKRPRARRLASRFTRR